MKNTSEETELLLLPQMGSEKIPNYKQVVQVSLHHFYILGVIEGPEKYLDLVQTLKTVEEHDTVFIYINSVGGSLYTTIQIINAIQNCHGNVVTVLEGEACSAATIIFLAGHKHVINPFGAFMVHKYSHGVEGKGSDVREQVKFTERYFDQIAYALYADLMSKEEIAQMLDGKDFWFSSDEVLDRLVKSGNREILGLTNEATPEEESVEAVEQILIEDVVQTKTKKSKTDLTARKKS